VEATGVEEKETLAAFVTAGNMQDTQSHADNELLFLCGGT
jgi:hypothetical protein